MYKAVTILYIVCLGCYILFTRQPDFFDGETSPATIHWLPDSTANKPIPKAVFIVAKKEYAVDARYVFRNLYEGKATEVIFTSDHPEKAAIYNIWGYWLQWGEILGSILVYIALFQVAVAVTKNPTPEAVLEQMEDQPATRKRRYDV